VLIEHKGAPQQRQVITVSGPDGWTYSTRVEDTKALAKVKVGDKDGCRRRTIYVATVATQTSIPSLSNSQWIRGAPSAWVDEASRLVSACVACARVDPSIALRAESPETYLDLAIHER
jgi:hypothetical protein